MLHDIGDYDFAAEDLVTSLACHRTHSHASSEFREVSNIQAVADKELGRGRIRIEPWVFWYNSSFMRGADSAPKLVSRDDAETLFHEFGHALHGLFSNVQYPSLADTQVYRDYGEFPSQLNEHRLSTPEVLQRFALYYQNGDPIPEELVGRIEIASTLNKVFHLSDPTHVG